MRHLNIRHHENNHVEMLGSYLKIVPILQEIYNFEK